MKLDHAFNDVLYRIKRKFVVNSYICDAFAKRNNNNPAYVDLYTFPQHI